MKYYASEAPRSGRSRTFLAYPLLITILSIFSIAATFLLSNTSTGVTVKTLGFSWIVGMFLIVCTSLHLQQVMKISSKRSRSERSCSERLEARFERLLENINEVDELFAGALKLADTFRLVSARIRETLPVAAIELLLLDETRSYLQVVATDRGPATSGKQQEIGLDEGLPDRCYSSCRIEIERSSVAIPLRRNEEVFGVFQLYFGPDFQIRDFNRSLLEALGTQIAPRILASISFEKSQANALTDVTTDLPNAGSYYLALENKIAEACRQPESTALCVLALDVKGFDSINRKFGHAAGDLVLNFVARVMKDHLRQMDLLARISSDEFLALLPTANRDIALAVAERIQSGLSSRTLKINDVDSISVELSIGYSEFGRDGETADQLMTTARLRKSQVKSSEPSNILWFPTGVEVAR